MKKINALSDMEWEIIKVIWDRGEATVRDVWETAFAGGDKAYTTIQTYMERMIEKKILKRKKVGPVNVYSSMVKKQNLMKQATDNLVDRVFNGSFGQMAAFLVGSYGLSEKDIVELKKLVEVEENGKKDFPSGRGK
jgi:BlaI family penicillinase repressor